MASVGEVWEVHLWKAPFCFAYFGCFLGDEVEKPATVIILCRDSGFIFWEALLFFSNYGYCIGGEVNKLASVIILCRNREGPSMVGSLCLFVFWLFSWWRSWGTPHRDYIRPRLKVRLWHVLFFSNYGYRLGDEVNQLAAATVLRQDKKVRLWKVLFFFAPFGCFRGDEVKKLAASIIYVEI